MCPLTLYLGWKYHAVLNMSRHQSVTISLRLLFSPDSPRPAVLASCHPAKVIAIYCAGLICQSQPAILFLFTAGCWMGVATQWDLSLMLLQANQSRTEWQIQWHYSG